MNLLSELNNLVIPTNLTRKLTVNGETKVFPVYKININALYYNDQNDRIASWISQYKEENGPDSLNILDKSEYNNVIENFIVSSNPSSIDKTAMNIKLIGQREPGVVLNDGRIIDGNRRFTCIRKINKNFSNYIWFEAVILDMDINDNRKMIKMLELSIQHGEEKRVEYNRVEMLIGIYQDIVETKLLTIEEYAQSANASVAEIKREVASSKMLAEYLEYVEMPKQFYIAREYQLVSLISDVLDLFKKCVNAEMAEKLKKIIFVNQMMDAIGDERRFVRNISIMISNGQYYLYEKNQLQIEEKIEIRKKLSNPKNFNELKRFVKENDDLTEELKESMSLYLNNAKIFEVHNKPSQIVSKTLVSLKDIDTNIISKLTPVEKDKLHNQLKHLNSVINDINCVVGVEIESKAKESDEIKNEEVLESSKVRKVFTILPSFANELIEIKEAPNTINGLIVMMDIRTASQSDEYTLFFVDEENQNVSNVVNTRLCNEFSRIEFELSPKAEGLSFISLAIKKAIDKDDELRFLYSFKVDIGFGGDFEF